MKIYNTSTGTFSNIFFILHYDYDQKVGTKILRECIDNSLNASIDVCTYNIHTHVCILIRFCKISTVSIPTKRTDQSYLFID